MRGPMGIEDDDFDFEDFNFDNVDFDAEPSPEMQRILDEYGLQGEEGAKPP